MWVRVLHEHVGVRGQLLRVVFFPPHGSWGWTAGCQACSSALTSWAILSAPGNCSHCYNSTVCAISLMKNNTNPLRVCNSSTTFDNKEIDKGMQNKLGKVPQTYRIPAPRLCTAMRIRSSQSVLWNAPFARCEYALLWLVNKELPDQ